MELTTLTGMRRNLTLFALGICATLTLPPVYLFPLIIPAYGGLFLLLNGAYSRKRAFADGFWWGWGFYVTGLYWFCIALLTDPEKFAWMIPFALFGLTAVIALYSAVFGLLYYLARRDGVIGVTLFAIIWTVVEYGRGHLFTGFPWNLAGYSFNITTASLQLASLIGIYGLTFLTVWLGAICVLGKRYVLLAAIILACSAGWGAWRVSTAPQDYVEGIKLRLVQANIAQHHKWDPALQAQGLYRHMALTQLEGLEDITHVIWPETAVPFTIQGSSTLTRRLGNVLLPGQHLITGALRAQTDGDDYKLHNSIVVINDEGELVGHYDKFKLVPFGEFLPFRSIIPKGWQTPVGDRDFTAGPGNQSLVWPGLPKVSPLICYEVIFAIDTTDDKHKPSWLLSITNDAWFGKSSAPFQHLAMARMRAVEFGMPMVRVANTGITAVFDGYGREVGYLSLGNEGIVDIGLPAMIQSNTVYRRLFD